MPRLDSPVDKAALGRARALLKPPVPRDPGLAAVAAAAFFAIAALSFAMVTIMVPPVLTPSPASASAR
jgi:hypothetical protein